MKKVLILSCCMLSVITLFAQRDSTGKQSSKSEKKEARRERAVTLARQAEEGVLIFEKQNVFGIQGRSNGYGLFYELGRMKTVRKTMLYRVDLTEIKSQKEEKVSSGGGPISFSNPFVFGKINNFYQLTLGVGQQRILGQKGNRNGVAVSAVFFAGPSIGLLKPYYIEVDDPNSNQTRTIKYTPQDSALFLSTAVVGGAGLGKGWGEIKFKPGAFVKSALRFDFGRYNDLVSCIEAGLSLEFYAQKIPIMALQKDRQLFFQGHIAILFGRRK